VQHHSLWLIRQTIHHYMSRVLTLATDALANRGMDGSILSMDLASLVPSEQPGKLSEVLKGYYNHVLEGQDLGVVSSHIGPKRREIAQALVIEPVLLWFNLSSPDCPPIIPRCHWGAKPYRGSPFPLALPLPFLYIHHTYEPDRPCHSFRQCSRSMRAMQRFHQDDNGWADIGYSFVVGSDGYIYEGRHLGNHTRRQNPYGYGVAFIGNYSSSLPSLHALDLVRQHLAKCAVDGGLLQANFTLHGHHQLVDTSFPGDALYSEIRGWELSCQSYITTSARTSTYTDVHPSVVRTQ
uniref:Peptidoglycan recognition protein n=1 Tax=Oncorhynchus kisutch TaxID=8019 RepID=A0A8C7L859_ONCKI